MTPDPTFQLINELEKAETKVDDLERAVQAAIGELRRWQYSDDPVDVRHSIDMAIRTLERT